MRTIFLAQRQWREKFEKLCYLTAQVAGVDEAIIAYIALGFVMAGKAIASTKHPGKS